MAKISISGVLAKRKWTRIGTGIALLALVFFIVQLLIIDNPKKTKAATIIVNTRIGVNVKDWDDTDLIIDANSAGTPTTVIIAGQHHFLSLTIKGGSKLTHDALVAGTDFNISTSVLAQSGIDKKVDLTVDGDITLDSGGSINVDGKGYPGSRFQWSPGVYNGCNGDTEGDLYGRLGITPRSDTAQRTNYGFGPGGGISYQNYNGYSGGGGGFGGAGKLGTSATTGSGSYSYYNDSNSYYQHGSGGGAASHDGGGNDTACADGGSGGGIIILQASGLKFLNASSKISAEGANGNMFQDDGNAVGSGGGSGGLIKITTNSINYSSSTSWTAANFASGINPGSAGQLTTTDFDNNALFQISVKGGDRSDNNLPANGSGGGGGWIVVEKSSNAVPSVSIKKTLIPIQRPVGTDNTNFNPYALQKDDIIKVSLDISNLTDSFFLTDEFLETPGNSIKMKCLPDTTNSSDLDTADPQYVIGDIEVKWWVPSGSGANINRYYYCKVQ